MHNDPRILSNLPSELRGSDVHGIDFHRTMLEKAIGKPAGGRPDVKTYFALDIDREMLQGAGQFLTSAAHEPRSFDKQSEVRFGGNLVDRTW